MLRMSKLSRSQTAIELIIFNCFLFAISKIIPTNTSESNATTVQVIFSSISTLVIPNLGVFASLSFAYNYNKFLLQKKSPPILQRMIKYSLISFILPCIVTIYTFVISATNNLTALKFLWNALYQWTSELFQSFLNGKINILPLFASGVTLSFFPFIISWIVTGIFGITFFIVQIFNFKERTWLGNIIFVSLKLSQFLSRILAICIGITCLFLGLGLAAYITPIFYFFLVFLSSHLYLSGSWISLLGIVLLSWMIFSLLTGLLIIIISQVVGSLSFYSNRSNFHKVIHICVWKIYFPAIKILQLKVIPLTIFTTVSIVIHSIILRGLISFQERSLFIIDEVRIAEELIDFTMLYVMASPKWLWLFLGSKPKFLASQLESLQVVARQMLLMGNIKQAERLYAVFPVIVDDYNLNSSHAKRGGTFSLEKKIDILFKEIFEFYLRLNQKENIKSLYLKTNEYLVIKNLSFINALSIQMVYESHFNIWHEDVRIDRYSSQINSRKLLEILIYLLRYSPNSSKVNKPQDLNKLLIFLCSSLDDNDIFDYIFRNYKSNFLDLNEKIESFFITQSKIFAFSQNKNYNLTSEEIIIAISEVLNFNILGISLSFINPFINENYTLIPLILAESSLDCSLEVIDTLTDRATIDNRTFDLAFLYCCRGKVLVNRGEVKTGFSLLCDGIYRFEGIRNSVSSDRLGIGFGDGYLKFYDWTIDAAIQSGDIHQAFNYSEHAKARATLDLLCQRTSSSTSGALQKNLLELQNLDLSIAFVDSSIYSKLSDVNLLPHSLQDKLKSIFNNRKKRRIKNLNKKRKLIIQKIDKIDPNAASLIVFKPLSWSKKLTQSDYLATYDDLWQNQCIASNEAVISYHGLCDSQFTSGRQWNKIVCFYLLIEDNKIQLNHFMVDEFSIVTELQEESQKLISELCSKNNLSLLSISELLVQPMMKNLPGHLNKLIIMGNDEFQFMPWSAMYLDDIQLVDDFKIRVTPSLSLLFLLKEREQKRDRITPCRFSIAGVSHYPKTQDFLYWAGFEIESIAKLYNTKPIKNEHIDTYFIKEFCSSEIIHFSGHANYEVDESINALEQTYLCLYDRQLSAAQILDGALQSSTSKAMILSACLTGTGDLIGAGSEILGLERTLFYAGLSALVTTLWKIEDVPTSLLMIKFHSIWRKHNNSLNYLSSSLADAQIWLKNASWRDLKYEIEGFDNALEESIKECSILIDNELRKNPRADINSLVEMRDLYTEMKQYNDEKIPFSHPYYWAAFQVKGVG
jgi:CHAT domain-containing protein